MVSAIRAEQVAKQTADLLTLTVGSPVTVSAVALRFSALLAVTCPSAEARALVIAVAGARLPDWKLLGTLDAVNRKTLAPEFDVTFEPVPA